MKIAFTGDGTSGHFYPIVAMAEYVQDEASARHLVPPKLFYIAANEYNPVLLFNNQINFIKHGNTISHETDFSIGVRHYFIHFFGILSSLALLFRLYPDVILTKGGHDSFTLLVAAKWLGIPVVIHESDSIPSEINIWASKFAKRIATSYPTSYTLFPEKKTAYVGQPVRKEIEHPLSEGAVEYLLLEPNLPTILVLGGIENDSVINDTIVNSLPLLLDRYQIIHQTGRADITGIREISKVILKDSPHLSRYHPYSYLDDLAIRMSAGQATLAITQASSVIFELAAWQIPSIVIPQKVSSQDHQRKNAFSYARAGAGEVVEEVNLTPHLLVSEIDRLVQNGPVREQMKLAAKDFYKTDAGKKIADVLLDITITHEN